MSPAMDGEALPHFIDKWLSHCPHWRFGRLFVPVERREQTLAWLALVFEWRELLFAASDPRIRQAKGGWWVEELLGMERGAARHPLSRHLCAQARGWAAIAAAMQPLLEEVPVDADTPAAMSRLSNLAAAVLAVETQCLPSSTADGSCLARHWLIREWRHAAMLGDLSRLPMNLRARHALRGEPTPRQREAVLADWAEGLRVVAAGSAPGFLRGFEASWDDRLLRHGDGRVTPAWRGLWTAWSWARRASSA